MARKVKVPLRFFDVPFLLEFGGGFPVIWKKENNDSRLVRLQVWSSPYEEEGQKVAVLRGSTYCLQANTCAKKRVSKRRERQQGVWGPKNGLGEKMGGSTKRDWAAACVLGVMGGKQGTRLAKATGFDEPPDEKVDSV
jgi:hypothetical protein